MGAIPKMSTGMLSTPADIWSRAASPSRSDSSTRGTGPATPMATNAGRLSSGCPITRQQAASTTAMAASVTRPREASTCSALTFASMSVRSVCFSFSSASAVSVAMEATMVVVNSSDHETSMRESACGPPSPSMLSANA